MHLIFHLTKFSLTFFYCKGIRKYANYIPFHKKPPSHMRKITKVALESQNKIIEEYNKNKHLRIKAVNIGGY